MDRNYWVDPCSSKKNLRTLPGFDGYVNIHPSFVVAGSDKGGHHVLKVFIATCYFKSDRALLEAH
jgi:hypothetical protein